MTDEGKIFALTVFDKTVMQFRSRENANQMREDLIEDPQLFCQVKEWKPEPYLLPYVKVEEDQQELDY